MEDPLAHLLLSPAHLASLRDRLAKTQTLKNDILQAISSFEAYATAGDNLCGSMAQLAECFLRYNAFQKDATLQGISEALSNSRDYLSNLFQHVRQFVIVPLHNFVDTDIENVEQMSRLAARELDSYLRALDLHAGSSKKKGSGELTRRRSASIQPENRLKGIADQHFSAAVAHLRFDQALLKVERATLIEFSVNFLMFMKLSGVAYKQCYSEYESSMESFSELTCAIPTVISNLNVLASEDRKQMMRLKACHDEFWRCRNGEFSGSTALSHAGWLWKKGTGITKSWTRRFFQVYDSTLSYLHDEGDTGPRRGELDLMTVSVKPREDPERRNCFVIVSPFRKNHYILQALTQYDVQEWQAVLQNNVQWLLDHSGPEGSVEQSTVDGGMDLIEMNATCADCGSPNPSWCCINWGVCVCIKCAGVHRELSTSVSKVRSLTLDHLDPVIVRLFHQIGNQFANSILSPGGTTLTPNSERSERTDFIRRKYDDCEFVNVDEVEDIERAIESSDIKRVFKGLCQMRKKKETRAGLVRLAAAQGDPPTCLIVGLNSKNMDELDDAGWSPLMLAAYRGQVDVANALILAGCDPNAPQAGHPYFVAFSRSDAELTTLFLPYCDQNVSRPDIGAPVITVRKSVISRRAGPSLVLLPHLTPGGIPSCERPRPPFGTNQSGEDLAPGVNKP
jgi:hypothetical protein